MFKSPKDSTLSNPVIRSWASWHWSCGWDSPQFTASPCSSFGTEHQGLLFFFLLSRLLLLRPLSWFVFLSLSLHAGLPQISFLAFLTPLSTAISLRTSSKPQTVKAFCAKDKNVALKLPNLSWIPVWCIHPPTWYHWLKFPRPRLNSWFYPLSLQQIKSSPSRSLIPTNGH